MNGAERELFRIGELSRRSGFSAHTLRAWERRYNLLQPTRAANGYRLYSALDEARLSRMRLYLQAGHAASAAAALALNGPAPRMAPRRLNTIGQKLATALARHDDRTAETLLDEMLGKYDPEDAMRQVLLPHLREIGTRWADGRASVAQEHYETERIRSALIGLTSGWGRGHGPLVLLACAPGNGHDIGLLMCGIALSRRGWAVRYLGAATPAADLLLMAAEQPPDAIVVAGEPTEDTHTWPSQLVQLAAIAQVYVTARPTQAAEGHVTILDQDPIDGADLLTATVHV